MQRLITLQRFDILRPSRCFGIESPIIRIVFLRKSDSEIGGLEEEDVEDLVDAGGVETGMFFLGFGMGAGILVLGFGVGLTLTFLGAGEACCSSGVSSTRSMLKRLSVGIVAIKMLSAAGDSWQELKKSEQYNIFGSRVLQLAP